MATEKTPPTPPDGIDDHESLVVAIKQRLMPKFRRTGGKKAGEPYKALPSEVKKELAIITGGCSKDYAKNSEQQRIDWWHRHYDNMRHFFGDGGLPGPKATQERMRITWDYWQSNEEDALKHAMMCFCRNGDEGLLTKYIKYLDEDPKVWVPFIKEYGQKCLPVTQDEEPILERKPNPVMDSRFKIWAGIPGTGKSHNLNLAAESIVANFETDVFRTVFHPEYSFYDFVGQIQPKEVATGISYPFVPGPFVLALRKAFNEKKDASVEGRHPGNVVLIIDELNRGNAAAIFGEIFQLLDLDETGESKYGVHNHNIAKAIGMPDNQDIKIPSNFYIYASMNISDQNVFPLDTAFLRRWDREYTSAENWEGPCRTWQIPLPDGDLKWENFATVINSWIIEKADDLGISNPEDKRLGPWFVESRHCGNITLFANKVIVYLWTNVFTHTMSRRGAFIEECKTLEGLLNKFLIAGLAVFESNLANNLRDLLEKDMEVEQRSNETIEIEQIDEDE